MKLLEQKATYIPQQPGVEGIYKQIERCARVCYQSEAKIDGTFDSAKAFVDRMIKSHHTAMLESCSIYLMCERNFYDNVEFENALIKYANNKYSKLYYDMNNVYVTTNLRVIVENQWEDDLKYVVEPTDKHEKRYTFILTTDRAIANEIVRHRVFSYAQSSTRFIDYAKDKEAAITFIKPEWFDNASPQQQEAFLQLCMSAEYTYFELRGKFGENKGFDGSPLRPEQARNVLPLDLQTDLCMTGYESDWRFFLDLRLLGKTGKPHEQIKNLCELIVNQMKNNGLYDGIMNYKSRFE